MMRPLLFLIFPMGVITVDGKMADQILYDVTHHLEGDHGIRRYLGDSYWAPDYKKKLKPEERTIDYSDHMAQRDRLVMPGQEAQWCIFDPIISIICGLEIPAASSGRTLAAPDRLLEPFIEPIDSRRQPLRGLHVPGTLLSRGRAVCAQ